MIPFRGIAFLALLALGGCVNSGTGSGTLAQPGVPAEPVTMEWHSNGDTRGTIVATLPSGDVLSGRYLQVTRQVDADQLGPMWEGWDAGWSSWPYGNGTAATEDFATVYTGKVVATLTTEQGKRLRCRFELRKTASRWAACA